LTKKPQSWSKGCCSNCKTLQLHCIRNVYI